MNTIRTSVICSLLYLLGLGQSIAATPAPGGASVYIVSPQQGEVLSNPVVVRFGLRNMGVAPAGVDRPNTGHHHLLIDVDNLPPMDQPLPNDDRHRHFGGGQTEVSLQLAPGEHSLQLILGDLNHIPHSPPIMSERISITVK